LSCQIELLGPKIVKYDSSVELLKGHFE